MFGLAQLKRRTGRAMDSETLSAEAAMTFLDGCLSTAILIALVLNAWLGWWWTDATATLVVAAFAAGIDGIGHWRESAPHLPTAPHTGRSPRIPIRTKHGTEPGFRVRPRGRRVRARSGAIPVGNGSMREREYFRE